MNHDVILTETTVHATDHLGLVHWCARAIETKYYDREDLVQIGIIGLLEAIAKYDPARGVKFSAYAVHRIRGEMLSAIQEAALDYQTCREVWWANVTSQYTRSSCDFPTYKPRREVA